MELSERPVRELAGVQGSWRAHPGLEQASPITAGWPQAHTAEPAGTLGNTLAQSFEEELPGFVSLMPPLHFNPFPLVPEWRGLLGLPAHTSADGLQWKLASIALGGTQLGEG